MTPPAEVKLYFDCLRGDGRAAEDDHIFGVPILLFEGEPFWDHACLPLLGARLADAGLAR